MILRLSTIWFSFVLSVPTTALAEKSTADYVGCAQRGLTDAGFYEGLIDGDAGPGTQAALAGFIDANEGSKPLPVETLTRSSAIEVAATWCAIFEAPWMDFVTLPDRSELIPYTSKLTFNGPSDKSKILNGAAGMTVDLISLRNRCDTVAKPLEYYAQWLMDPAWYDVTVPDYLKPYVVFKGRGVTQYYPSSCDDQVEAVVVSAVFSPTMPEFAADVDPIVWTFTGHGGQKITLRPWLTPLQKRRLNE